MSESTRSRWILPSVLVVAVVALVAVALARGPVSLDPDSAEGTVQEYLVALDEEDFDTALSLLHPQWGDLCTADDLRFSVPTGFTAKLGHSQSSNGFSEFGIVQKEFGDIQRDLPGGTEFVEVTITRNDQFGGIGGGGWDEWVIFELVDQDDFYWIVGDPWPYFTWNCQGR